MRTDYSVSETTLLALNSPPSEPIHALMLSNGYLWADTTIPAVSIIYILNNGTPVSTSITGIQFTSTQSITSGGTVTTQQLVLQPQGITLSISNITYLLLPNGLSYSSAAS